MKHLISLSLKYIRRQKLRTWLTFLCVTLAVFIFNLLAGAASIVRNTLIENVIARDGAWEVSADPLIEKACMKLADELDQKYSADGVLTDEEERIVSRELNELDEKLRRQIHGHLAADRCFTLNNTLLQWNQFSDSEPAAGQYRYFEVTAGGKTSQHQMVSFMKALGDSTLLQDSYNFNLIPEKLCGGEENMIFLPESMEAEGWKQGDTYEITFTPVSAVIPDDSAQIEEIRRQHEQELAEHPGAALFYEQKPVLYNEDRDRMTDQETREYILPWTKLDALKREFGFGNIQFSDIRRGKTGTLRLTVGGFVPDSFRGSFRRDDPDTVLFVSYGTDLSVLDEIARINSDLKETVTDTDADGNMTGMVHVMLSAGSYEQTMLTIRPDLNFDDAMEQLYRDLGLNPEESDSVLHPMRPEDKHRLYNTELLSLKLRGTDSIAEWLTDFETKLPLLIAVLVTALLLWVLMRMVIDNAFEISVQERRAQFATLRIMGASRRQVAALVCLEALFYCVAAIPLGMFAAWLCAKLTAHAFDSLGLGAPFRTSPLLMLIFTLIAVAAVFFSAYGSSMWAARAYAPLEASKRSVLKGNKKQSIWTRSLFGDPEQRAQKRAELRARKEKGLPQAPKKAKLRRSFSGFLRHYTMRNIRRTRRRFIVSVVTMSVGVMLFFFGSVIGLFFAGSYSKIKNEIKTADFCLDFWNGEGRTIEEAEQRFLASPHFASVNADVFREIPLDSSAGEVLRQTDSKAAELLLSVNWDGSPVSSALLVTPAEYKEIFEPLTGVSYEEWSKSLKAYFVISDNAYTGDSELMNYDVPVELKSASNGMDSVSFPLLGSLNLSQADAARYFAHRMSFLEINNSKHRSGRLLLPVTALSKLLPIYSGKTEICFTVRSTDDYKAAKEELTAFCQENPETAILYDEYYSGTGFKTLLTAIVTIAAVALLSLWMTGILSMINTVNTSVLNRADELMMLRTVGMSKKAVRRTVRLESMIFSGTATLIGCVLGAAGAFFLASKIDISGDTEMMWVLPMFFAAVGAAFLLTVLLNLLVASVAALPALRTLNARMEEGGMIQ